MLTTATKMNSAKARNFEAILEKFIATSVYCVQMCVAVQLLVLL
jgi:hypothetical protein